MTKIDEKDVLDAYTDPSNPGAFSGYTTFKKNNKKFKSLPILNILKSTETYSLHKPTIKKFKTRKFLADDIDHIWQIDLIDVQKLSGSNFKNKYIFTAIDIFSKKAFTEPMKNKEAASSLAAIKNIFKKSDRKPRIIYMDKGNEFKREFEQYLSNLSPPIQLITTNSKLHKAALVERFNRTIKEKLWRYFTFNKHKSANNLNKNSYLDVLDKLVENYNNTYHTSIKRTPNSVNKNNQNNVREALFGYKNPNEFDPDNYIKFKFKEGDFVRKINKKNIFDKGYTIKWDPKVHIIDKRLPSNPPTYTIKHTSFDLSKIKPKNKQIIIEGTFIKDIGFYYEEQLQAVPDFISFEAYEFDNKKKIEYSEEEEEEEKVEKEVEKKVHNLRTRK